MLKRDEFKELMRLRDVGLNIAQVARRLGVSYPTVKSYWNLDLAGYDKKIEDYYRVRTASKAEVYREDIKALILSGSDILPYQLYGYFKNKYGFDPVCCPKTLVSFYKKIKKELHIPEK